MKILIACEFSGRIRSAFRKKGHEAWSCDIIPSDDNSHYHIMDDVLKHLDCGWELMIAHPPCTYLSNCANGVLFPKGVLNQERYKLGLKAKEFFLTLLNANIPKICIENPVQARIFDMPKYTQIIQPYYFGEPFQKKTLLWLKNLPNLKPTNIVDNPIPTSKADWFNKYGKDRAKKRSITFQGIADAIADQWS
jgi:hypothetical protein